MRELKFRGWDGQKLTEPFELGSELSMRAYESVIQFTGLRDKDGKEIYEGDIVGYCREENDRDWVWLGRRVFETEFRNGEYVLHCRGIRSYGNPVKRQNVDEWKSLYDFLNHRSIAVEIIGNIYENPELLK